jgi:uncharacterized protein YjiS (DUF1127 family)
MNVSMNKTEFAFKLPEMLSYHSTWDDADYEPVQPHRQAGLLARTAGAVKRSIAAYMDRQRVINEMSRLSDRDLADLGLSRYDIKRVFDPVFAAEHAARRGG